MEEEKQEIIFSTKEFINEDPHTTSYIAAAITRNSFGPENKYEALDISLDIADCQRKISIEFWGENLDKDLVKLDKIINTLTIFKGHLQKVNIDYKKRQKDIE